MHIVNEWGSGTFLHGTGTAHRRYGDEEKEEENCDERQGLV